MAVFPDRIVLKNSTDAQATIEAAIGPGGADEINQGELVVGLENGSAKFYTKDANNNIVTLGSATTGVAVLGDLADVDLSTPATNGQVIAYNSTSGNWEPVNQSGGGGGMNNVVEDTTPQLGGNLDVNGFYINSASGGDVTIAPDTTGSFVVRGNSTDGSITLNCTANTHGVTIQSPPHSDAATYSLILPSSAGTAGQVLTSQGGAQLTWENAGSGGGGGEGGGRGDGGDFDTGTVDATFVMGVYGGGDFNAGSAATTAVAPFAHAYIDVDNVSSTTSHTGMSSAAHVYSSGVESYIDFTFDTPQPDTDYSVLHSGESGWNVLEVENKTTSGFRVSFYDEATGNFLSSAAVGIGAPVITVYKSDPTITVSSSSGVDLPVELLNSDEGPDGGAF